MPIKTGFLRGSSTLRTILAATFKAFYFDTSADLSVVNNLQLGRRQILTGISFSQPVSDVIGFCRNVHHHEQGQVFAKRL